MHVRYICVGNETFERLATIDLKVPEESSFKDSSLFDRSEILREQLRILEENASLFARGCVWTDGIKVVNRHKDYEFFSSHK